MTNESYLNEIRETYADMYDEQLLAFARNEGTALTGAAFMILRDELSKRNIGADILAKIEHDIILNASIDKQKAIENLNRNLYEEALELSFSQKAEGISNYQIYVRLVEKGIDAEHANTIVNRLDEWTDKLKKDSSNEIQAGFAIMVIGIVAILITIEIGQFQAGAILLVLVGIIKTLVHTTKKHKYEKISKNIDLENKD